jgi:tRNA pseudouridine13 synthase
VKPRAVIRRVPEDFVVEELPAYEPCGTGEHLYVRVRKRKLTTPEALSRICRALLVDGKGAGFAGMKDRHAVTVQTLSIPFAMSSPLPAVEDLQSDGLDVLWVERHTNKLKPGHLRGNRFTILLRELGAEHRDEAAAALRLAGEGGVPNAFGPQRFGKAGDNFERSLAWLTGSGPRPPRDPRKLRFLFSAFQARLFNDVLGRRVAQGTYDRPLAGDLLKKHATGGLFCCSEPDRDVERAASGELSPTGPMFGVDMRWPEGKPAEIEREVLESVGGMAVFERNKSLGQGTRRSLRLLPSELVVDPVPEDPGALCVRFVLPKGGYATTLLACAVQLSEDSTSEEEMVAE